MLRKKIIACVAVAGLFCCALFVAGCGVGENFAKQSSPEQNYVTSLNALMKTFYGALDGFQDSLKAKDTDAMDKNLSSCQDVIDSVSKLDVPDSCKDIQTNYLDGLNAMQKALSDYVQVYKDYNAGKLDANALASKVAEIQKSYNSALDSLKKADAQVSKL